MDEDERVLSDIHVGAAGCESAHSDPERDGVVESERYDKCVSRFTLWWNELAGSESNNLGAASYDSDGDLMVERSESGGDGVCRDVITIEHRMSTVLRDVGLQLWSGALLLSDFLLDLPGRTDWRRHLITEDTVVLELGAGLGLVSIVAVNYTRATHVYATDRGPDILSLCEHNIEMNCDEATRHKVSVKHFDWDSEGWPVADNDTPTAAAAATAADDSEKERAMDSSTCSSRFTWSDHDVTDLRSHCQLILGADLIYDIDATCALFAVLREMLCAPPGKTCVLSVEKRINFTTSDDESPLDEDGCHDLAYEHFLECLQILRRSGGGRNGGKRVTITTRKLTSLPTQHVACYRRNARMEIWIVEAKFSTHSSLIV